MADVLSKIYTVLDTISNFFEWVYNSGSLLANWLSEQWHFITDLIAAVPSEWALAISVMAAAALVYLVIGR